MTVIGGEGQAGRHAGRQAEYMNALFLAIKRTKMKR
jgi:hypothetical protein